MFQNSRISHTALVQFLFDEISSIDDDDGRPPTLNIFLFYISES